MLDLNVGGKHKTFLFFYFSCFFIPIPAPLTPTGAHGDPQADGGETGRGRAGGGEDGCRGSPPESRGAEAPRGEEGEGGGGVEGASQPSRWPDKPGAGGAARRAASGRLADV